ncbi:putative reverse transcriptase domain-containing protein [Tanacetum coccineum]
MRVLLCCCETRHDLIGPYSRFTVLVNTYGDQREFGGFTNDIRCPEESCSCGRAAIEVLRRKRLASSREYGDHQALARSEAYCRALEARVTVLETEHVMQPEMGMIAILQERVPEGLCKLLVNCTNPGLPQMLTLETEECQTHSMVLKRNALTWWNSHVKTTTPEAAHAMPWRTPKKMMTDKYCPRGKIKKLEFQMWNLKVKGNDVVTYSQHFQELALMCDRMFPEESDKVEKYIGGLLDMIYGSVMETKLKTMQDAIEFATELMDKKISTFAERQAENKRKLLDNNNQAQQQLPKRQNVAQAYAAGTGERKEALCNKCKFHHNGPCTVKCVNCKRDSVLTETCWEFTLSTTFKEPSLSMMWNQGPL